MAGTGNHAGKHSIHNGVQYLQYIYSPYIVLEHIFTAYPKHTVLLCASSILVPLTGSVGNGSF